MAINIIPEKLIIIGASTGGPKIIEKIVSKLPRHLRAAIVIVQHLSSTFTESFAKRLRGLSEIMIREASDDDILFAGSVILLKGDHNFVVCREESSVTKKENFVLKITRSCSPGCVKCIKPNIDTIMTTAADSFGKGVIGIILSGMGDDGFEGAKEIRKKGGIIIIEDKASADIYGMPGKIYKAKSYDYILPPLEIAQKIIELSS